jgi:RNA recognition motif-containing protein
MSPLFLSNIPWNCRENDVRHWVESKGYPVETVDVIRDLVANASPAFAYVTLRDSSQNVAAIQALNGQVLKDRILQVKEDWRGVRRSTDGSGPCQTHE